ncbi:MAG: hypothetical protein NTV21_12755 [Planctomycetota bacterium]|nr:hypothetical protein [Planctomycetota bacterium]
MGERIVELQPQAPKVVGPGRRERAYQERIVELALGEAHAKEAAERLARELAVAERVERGTQRRIDRLEDSVQREREAFQRSEEAQKRLLLALGAVQRENELLRERVLALQAASAPRLEAPQAPEKGRRGLFGGRRSRGSDRGA